MSAVNDLEGCTYMSQSLPFGGCKKSGYDRFAGPEGAVLSRILPFFFIYFVGVLTMIVFFFCYIITRFWNCFILFICLHIYVLTHDLLYRNKKWIRNSYNFFQDWEGYAWYVQCARIWSLLSGTPSPLPCTTPPRVLVIISPRVSFTCFIPPAL